LRAKILFKVLLCLITITFLAGCGSDYETEIVGKWEDRNSNVVEFLQPELLKGWQEM